MPADIKASLFRRWCQKSAFLLDKMKLFAVAITGFLTLNIISVAFTASVRSYTVSDSEPPDWKEHVSEAEKRSMGCTGCASMDKNVKVTAEKRTMECTGCTKIEDNAEVQPIQPLSPNPMNPYLSLKPFLPAKPTFLPPFVDPNYFINKKADLLNNLFGATNSESSDPKPSSVEAKRESGDESVNSMGPRLAPFSPFLASSPTVKPTIVPPEYWMPMSGPGIVDPATMIDKKTKFLNTLFSKTTAPDSSVVARLAPFSPSLASSPTVKPTIVPPEYWMPMSGPGIVDPATMIDKKTKFLNTLFSKTTAPDSSVAARLAPFSPSLISSPTVKPTIVPPEYWMPMSGPGIMDPATMIDKKTKFLNTLFSKTTAPDSSVVARLAPFSPSLASSPTVKPTIVPPEYWMPMSGPGIVDPATMIDKKTKFLNTLFSKTTAPDSSVAARLAPFSPSLISSPTVKPTIVPPEYWMPMSGPGIMDPATMIDKKTKFLNTLFSKTTAPDSSVVARLAPFSPSLASSPTVKPTIVPPEYWMPMSGPGIVDPATMIDKKTKFLNTLFSKTTAPDSSVAARLAPFSPSLISSPTVKPTIVPLEYWMPMSGPGIVDPATMIDKKTKFLNTLFSKTTAPDSSVAARAVAPEDVTSDVSTVKESVLPPDFWLQFLPTLTTPEPSTVKPTIVPPGFWIPSSISNTPAKPFSPKVPIVDPSEFIDKKTAFLNTLFKTLNITTTPTTETTVESTPDSIPAYLQKTVSPTVKPTIVPPEYWMPLSGPGIVGPATIIDKKTKFLNTLFSKIAASDSSVAARAVVPEALTSAASTAKQSVAPADFWVQFLPSLTTPEIPTVKPTIVPPGFWVPSYVSKFPAKPFGPKIPSVDPSEFIDKKTAFLNTLFKTLNITITPSPVTTPDPIADFLYQLMSSAIDNSTQQGTPKRSMTERGENGKTDDSSSPSEEHEAVNDILKVTRQSSTKFNKRSTITEDISVPSPMAVDAVLDAKDRLMNTIMGALSGIKNNILDTVTELLAQQKEAGAISASTASKKKLGPSFGPGGPFGPWGAALLKTTPKSTPDPTPFQNKIAFLSQMFDAVTKLENDVTDALNEAINESFSKSTDSPTVTPISSMDQATNATALLQLIKTKLSELANDNTDMQVPKFSRATFSEGFSTGLPTPKPTIVEPSFWIPKVTPGLAVDPTFYLSKTQDFLSKLFASKATGTSADSSEIASNDKVRSIKMAVHQGYQSLPPGTEELLQAGGGSNSMDHEGGGLKLQDDVVPAPAIPNNKVGHHHHNHHNNK